MISPLNFINTLQTPQNDQEAISWLQLIRSENIGPIIFWELLRYFKNPTAALENHENYFSKKNRSIKICDRAIVEQEFQKHKTNGYHLLPAYHPFFPQSLLKWPDCPPVISVYGNLEAFQATCISIVGARNASLGGRQLAQQFATELAQNQWCIVSGMARGIDEMAHRGALKTNLVKNPYPTIAVMAGGIDKPYPYELTDLYHAIAKNGAIISEMPLGTSPIGYLFSRRNRLIAALSQGTVVIEAALKSGSLLTAHYALEQNSEIFAVPGSPLDPRCRGSNSLIRQGATLVETAADILNELTLPSPKTQQPTTTQNTPSFSSPLTISEKHLWDPTRNLTMNYDETVTSYEEKKAQILSALTLSPISINDLSRTVQFALSQLLPILLELEVSGHIERLSYHLVALKPNSAFLSSKKSDLS